MLVTRHGRLVKTLGLPDNLQQVSNLPQDPLADALHLRDGANWTRIVQWTENGKTRAAAVSSRFARGTDEVLTLAGRRVACRVWTEQARIAATGRAWENTFWIDNSSGEVVQARQMLAADDFPVATTLLKPAKS